MNKKTAAAAFLLAFLLGMPRGGSSGGRKILPGANILIVGDSQSVKENPHSPGQLLAGKLRAAGFGVRVLAVGGKTAYYFSLTQEGRALLSGELAQRPAVVLVFLGSNELANVAVGGSEKSQAKGHQALRDLIIKAGARPFFVGPPRFGAKVHSKDKDGKDQGEPLENFTDSLTPRLRAVYTERDFLDARPFCPVHKGIHFDKDSAEDFAAALAPAILARLTP